MKSPLRVLVVEDEENDYFFTMRELRRNGAEVEARRVWTEAAMREALAEDWDIVLSDYAIPGFGGPQALATLQATGRDIPFIMISGTIGEEAAIETLKAGASDFITKGRMARLTPAISRSLGERENRAARARAEEELRRSNAELEQFAYVAAHDLQEPLRMISSYLQLIQRRLGERLDGRTAEYFHHVVASAQRMRAMVAGILDYSLIAREGPRAEVVDTDAAARQATDSLAAQIAEARAEVEIAPLPPVRANEAQVTRLFQNLISNAVKFHGDTPPRVAIRGAREGDRCRFTVADNGIGIEPQYREGVFRIFQRLQPDETPGVGIGLAACKKIVEQHGGRIWVESPTTDHGVVFAFTLPSDG
jgi:signal transduction histidine kinase